MKVHEARGRRFRTENQLESLWAGRDESDVPLDARYVVMGVVCDGGGGGRL